MKLSCIQKDLYRMKKLKLFIPTLILSAGAIAPLMSVTSCSKEIEGYTVDQSTHHIYGLDKNNKRFKLTDKQIEDLAGGFLLTLGDESFVYIDKNGNGDDGQTYTEKSIKDFMKRASTKHAFYYEIWLLGGTYNLDAPDVTSHIKFDIKGIVNNDDEITSSVNIVPGHNPDGEQPLSDTIDLGNFRTLNFSTVNIIGSKNEKQGFSWKISGSNEMSFEYCNFYGLSVFETEYLDLYGCTIDSDCIKWGKIASRQYDTTQYGLVVRNVDFASFSYCNFISDGKAIKLYPTGGTTEAPVKPTYVFNTCDFSIGPKGIPQGDQEREPGHNEQDKYAVECNNTQIKDLDHKLCVYWYGITGDILDHDVESCADQSRDWKHHSGTVGSYDRYNEQTKKGEYDPEKAEIKRGDLPS